EAVDVAIDREQILADERWFHPALENIAWTGHERCARDACVGMDATHAVVVDAKRVALARNVNAEGFHIRDADAFHFSRERANRGEYPSQSYGGAAEEIPSSNQSASGDCSKVYNEYSSLPSGSFCIHEAIGIKWRAFRMKAALMNRRSMNRRS